ncbi:MAG: hypothetical protein WKF57_05945 [Nakamurella sp.]
MTDTSVTSTATSTVASTATSNVEQLRALPKTHPGVGGAAIELARAAADEIEHLRDHSDIPGPCKVTHTPPFDFAQCETHDETFALGSICKWHGAQSISEVLQAEADDQRGLKVRAEMELDRHQCFVAELNKYLSTCRILRVEPSTAKMERILATYDLGVVRQVGRSGA